MTMPTPQFVPPLLGRRVTPAGLPNISDGKNKPSVAISDAMLTALGSQGNVIPKGGAGTAFEDGVAGFLVAALPGPPYVVDRKESIALFAQYAHLARLDELLLEDGMGTVRAEVGRDYRIKPDVTVARPDPMPNDRTNPFPLLHASVSCKWTLRSDRAQNVRHESNILIRHRRGRLPHVTAVTLEPLPSRIASLARGTGEVDAVYHAALDELYAAVRAIGTASQVGILDELVGQGRLFDLDALATRLGA